jgi:tetraprenyl-beta-curcumene synthase
MSTTTHINNGHAPAGIPMVGVAAGGAPRPLASVAKQLELPRAFADVVLRYLLLVLPSATRELSQWRSRAGEIPNPHLRRHALQALGKRGNIEGAALFATLAPAAHRPRAVRALVAFQTAYNYLYTLSELPSRDPVANGEQLHQALLTALHPGVAHSDYYAHNPDQGDGGYLCAILDATRRAVAGLPSFSAMGPTAREAAGRIVDFQTLNLSESQGGHDALQRWATAVTPVGSGLAWWETAASAGSSLAVHALIAASADPHLDSLDAREIDSAYWPWLGALHSLLDSLVDRAEDHQNRQLSLLDYYHSPADAAINLTSLATRARDACEHVPNPSSHRVIATAMCSYYLSAPECDTHEGRIITRALTRTLGIPLNVAILMFRVRRVAATLTRGAYT